MFCFYFLYFSCVWLMRGTASFWASHQHASFRDMVNFVYFNDVKSIGKFSCWLYQSLIMSFQKPRHDSRSVCLVVIDKKKQEFSVPQREAWSQLVGRKASISTTFKSSFDSHWRILCCEFVCCMSASLGSTPHPSQLPIITSSGWTLNGSDRHEHCRPIQDQSLYFTYEWDSGMYNCTCTSVAGAVISVTESNLLSLKRWHSLRLFSTTVV